MRVVITNGCSDLGVLTTQSLHRAGFAVFACTTRPLPRWLAARNLKGLAFIDAADRRGWQDQVLHVIARSRADLFLPLCTRGALLAVERRGELASLCRFTAPDGQAFFSAYDKQRCMEACASLGIACAGSLSQAQAQALLHHDDGSRIVVKPAYDAGAARGMQVVAQPAELEAAIAACVSQHQRCLLQEFIPGDGRAMRSLSVVLDGEGQLVGSFLMRKRRHWPSSGGVTACGSSCREPGLLEMALPLLRHWNWRGPAEVEFKWDRRDGRFKLIEVNPRCAGNLRLASVAGVDLPLLAARTAAGIALPPVRGLSPYRDGVTYLAPSLFARSVAADAARRGWRRALAAARADATGSGPMLRSLLAEPLPLLARTVLASRARTPEQG